MRLKELNRKLINNKNELIKHKNKVILQEEKLDYLGTWMILDIYPVNDEVRPDVSSDDFDMLNCTM